MKPPRRIPRNWHLRKPHQQRSKHTCPLSNWAQPHKLTRRREFSNTFKCFMCKGVQLKEKRYYYYCPTCSVRFHRGCHVLPMEMKHPLHLAHPLALVSLDPTKLDTSRIPHEWRETSSDSEVSDYDYLPDEEDGDYQDDYDDVGSASTSNGKCKCCNRRFEDLYYHCSICNFSLNFTCTMRPPLETITYRKSHIHTLFLFPRRTPLPCDACGLSLNNIHDVVYACLPCNYMVHRGCIKFPRAIKITCHTHRLSLIPSLTSGDYSCGLCRKAIDISFGHYSCKDCHYGVHSKCATRKGMWDGRDLDGVPEEPEKNTKSFMRIDEETIRHFSHVHDLKLQREGSVSGEKRFCEACCIPVLTSDVMYSCKLCNFVLHEACASLPLVNHHPLHKHPLILHQNFTYPYWFWGDDVTAGMFECHGCLRKSSGFVYRCGQKGCVFQLDIRCASVLDTSIHQSHDHPLFVNLTEGECMGCKSTKCSGHYLECLKCKSYLGLHCATLPSVAYYEDDSHPLTLCYGKKGTISGQYWCELCELKLDSSEWFYTCEPCSVTLHVTCLLGIDMYMKPRHIVKRRGIEVKITCTDDTSRPFCYVCGRRCIHKVFKCQGENICTLQCLHGFLNKGSKKRRQVPERLFPVNKIGVDSRLVEIEDVLEKLPWGVCIIGICGMAGIGKTTLAEAAFTRMQNDYECTCFIWNFEKKFQTKGLSGLRERLPPYVREKLDRNKSVTSQSQHEKSVFMILDDVRKSENAVKFLGGFDWFEPGSLIIITSSDADVLRQCKVHHTYDVKGLDDKEALQLFSRCAFGELHPKESYRKVSKMVVEYANGNAKALSYYGRELKGKTSEEMETVFSQLKRCPPPDILELFKSSYDELSDKEKKIFLDIACFFKGESVEHVMRALERYDFLSIRFKCLIDKSFVFVSGNKVEMHELVHDVAWGIQNQEVQNGKACRLCGAQSIQPLLQDVETKENGEHSLDPENIETMFLDASGLSFVVDEETKANSKYSLDPENIESMLLNASRLSCVADPVAFQSMKNLRLLKIYSSDHEHPPRLAFPKGLAYLPSELWLLHWEYYVLETLPEDFDPDMLVELTMPYSQLLKLWEGSKSLPSLKRINLHNSEKLVEVNQLSEARSLEFINLQDCTSLQIFPAIVNLEHLKILNLSGCAEIKIFPKTPPNLEELYLNGTAIRETPISLETLSKLVKLDLGNCRELRNFEIKICNMESLELLNLSGCITLTIFPEIDKTTERLQYLYLSCTAIQELHTSVSRLIGLKVVKVSSNLMLPKDLLNIKDLKVEREDEIAEYLV